MHPRSSPSIADRNTYIPPQAERAISQHLQESLPANLRSYADPSRTGYVPPQVQKQITEHLQTSMPTHLQQYAGAYVQQRVADPMGLPAASQQASRPSPHPPVPDRLRLDHAMPTGEQFTVQAENLPTANNLFQPDAAQTPPPVSGGTAPPPTQGYEFITNPPAPPKRRAFSLPGSSLPRRLLISAIGLFALVIIIVVVKGLLGGGTNYALFTPVLQDQQELIHLTTNAIQQKTMTTADQNFAITAQLSLTSAQSQLLTYLKNQHQKVGAKVLTAKVSTSLDSQLATAASNSTYDQTFQQIMQSQLTTYEQALSQAYKTAGPNGKKQLNSDYNQAQLLLKQISPAS